MLNSHQWWQIVVFICYYSSFYPQTFNQAGSCHSEPCTSLSCWSFIEAFLSNHFSHTKTTHTQQHTRTHTFCYWLSCLRAWWQCVTAHTDTINLLDSSVKPHKHKQTQSSSFLSLMSALWTPGPSSACLSGPECCCLVEITPLKTPQSPSSSQGLLVFGASGQNLSSEALGRAPVCSLQTHWEIMASTHTGRETAVTLRAGAAASNTHWGRSQGFRCCW